MSDFVSDGRIKFARDKDVVISSRTGSISLQIFGGPMARFQVAIFSTDNNVLQSVGNGEPPLTTFEGGKASWLFSVFDNASHIKWRVQAFKSAANLSDYSVTVKVRNANGDALATSQFSRTIAGNFADDWIADGVFFARAVISTIPPEPQA